MGINRDQTYTLSPDVLFQEVSGEIVLLDLASDNYFGLDVIGARIWQILSGGGNVGEILDKLLDEYDVEQSVLESDVGDLLENLSKAGLIKA